MSGFGGVIASRQGLTGKTVRPDDDFYPTPWEASEAFLRREARNIKRDFRAVWEPACGAGAMAGVLKEHLFTVYASDKYDHGYGEAGRDFLLSGELKAPVIITNPPFRDNLPEKFVKKARSLGASYLALLLKSDYWNAGCRLKLFYALPPSRCYPLGWRVDFTGKGRNFFNTDWWVWDWRYEPGPHECRFCPPLEKPKGRGNGVLL